MNATSASRKRWGNIIHLSMEIFYIKKSSCNVAMFTHRVLNKENASI